MKLECFFRSMFAAIAISFIPFMLFFWSNESDFITMDVKYFYESLNFVVIFYVLFSLIGWAFIGFPVHWLANKYFNQSWWCYFLGVAFFGLALALPTKQIELFWFYACIAGLQAFVFLWWQRARKT